MIFANSSAKNIKFPLLTNGGTLLSLLNELNASFEAF